MKQVNMAKTQKTKPATEAPANGRVRGQGAQTVYEPLRQSILELELEPGSPLDESSLSEQCEMSCPRTREALVRLAGEGPGTTRPSRTTAVSTSDFVRLPL